MSITLNLRYQKKDKWGSEIFIASPKHPEEEKAFETLRTLASKVEDMNLGTFSPVFHNDVLDYCTIRFKFYKGMKLDERNLYTVNFVIKKSTRDKTYVNCFVNTIKLHTKAKPQDQGEIISFDL
jgi:H2-forming N5,N10-methylenetetrahydromethanopterin dehydrogenase-like enzyme